MVNETAIAVVLGALICLDRVVVQFMISRPIVAGPMIGLALGDPYTGLTAGAFLELLWVDRIPVGPYVPPNDTFVAILTTAGAILAAPISGHPSRELIALAILVFAPAGFLGQKMEILLRKWNDGLVLQAAEDAKTGDVPRSPAGISRAGTLSGWIPRFPAIALTCGTWLLRGIYQGLPGTFLGTLAFAVTFFRSSASEWLSTRSS